MRSICKCLFLLLCFGACAIAAPAVAKASTKISGAVESKAPFSGERLFAVLDSAGGTGTWMEWDSTGVKDPSIMSVVAPSMKTSQKPQMVWVISEREKPLMAILFSKGAGEVLVFYELSALDAKPEPLKLNPEPDPRVFLRDYRQESPTVFVHLDKPNLKISISEKLIRFTYEKADKTALRYDRDFAKKTFVEKRSEVRSYMDYFRYEYALMLRAFVQSVRGLFNWQPWHWYMDSWNHSAFIKADELEAILSKGFPPEYVTIFKTRAATGETVEFRVNGNGFFEMDIFAP